MISNKFNLFFGCNSGCNGGYNGCCGGSQTVYHTIFTGITGPRGATGLTSNGKTENSVFTLGGNKYNLTRHFTGSKDINKVVEEFAFRRADRETELNCRTD